MSVFSLALPASLFVAIIASTGFKFKLSISHDKTSADSMENWFPCLRCQILESAFDALG